VLLSRNSLSMSTVSFPSCDRSLILVMTYLQQEADALLSKSPLVHGLTPYDITRLASFASLRLAECNEVVLRPMEKAAEAVTSL